MSISDKYGEAPDGLRLIEGIDTEAMLVHAPSRDRRQRMEAAMTQARQELEGQSASESEIWARAQQHDPDVFSDSSFTFPNHRLAGV